MSEQFLVSFASLPKAVENVLHSPSLSSLLNILLLPSPSAPGSDSQLESIQPLPCRDGGDRLPSAGTGPRVLSAGGIASMPQESFSLAMPGGGK